MFASLTTTAIADQLPVWKSAMLSGSPRLSFFSILATKPKGHGTYLKSLMLHDGLLHKKGQGPQKVASYFAIKPLIGYDTNINSGIPTDEFKLGDFTFRTDEEDQAKAGITIGGVVMGSLHYSIAPAYVLKFSGNASYEYAFEHKLSKHSYGASTCLASHVASYTWIDSCAGLRVADKKNAHVEELYASLGGSQVFASGIGHHEANWAVKRAFREDYPKTYVNLGLNSVLEDVGAIYTGITWGQQVDGVHTSLWNAYASLTRPIFGRKTTIAIGYGKSGGGTHFGSPREDEQYTIKVSSQVHENVALSAGYSWSDSDIEMYDDNSVLFGVDLKTWKF